MTNDNPTGYRLGADIGGTFTDLVIAAPDGGYWTKKLSSTQDDLSRGIIEGMGPSCPSSRSPSSPSKRSSTAPPSPPTPSWRTRARRPPS